MTLVSGIVVGVCVGMLIHAWMVSRRLKALIVLMGVLTKLLWDAATRAAADDAMRNKYPEIFAEEVDREER
jgi:F0F1-type ATP synthase assembly protein I